MSVPRLRFKEFGGAWEESELGSHCETTTGRLDANAMRADGAYKFFTCAREVYQIDEYAFDTEALLVSGNGANVGYIHYYSGKFNAYQRTYVLDKFDLDIRFVQRLLERDLRKRIYGEVKEGNTPYIVKGTLTEMPIAFPTLPEQKKIAAFLGVVDAKIAALRARVLGLQGYKRGLMQALFSQTLRFTKPDGTAFPDWEEKRLGEVANCLDSKRRPLNSIERQVMQGPYPYFGANGQVDSLSEYLFDEDIVLLAEDGGNFEEFATRPIAQRITGKCWVNNHAHILTAKNGKFTHAFLFYSLVHKDIRSHINGSSRAKLNKSDMLSISMPVPHPDEQAKIAEALSAMDAKIAAVQDQVSKMQDFKKGLLQQMFV